MLTSILSVVSITLVSVTLHAGFPSTPMPGMPAPGMPQLTPQDFEQFLKEVENNPEMQQLFKQIEDEFNKLPPEQKEQLNKQAEEEFRRMGIDPQTLNPLPTPQTPQAPEPKAPQPVKQQTSTPAEPTSDCSLVTSHSPQQVSCLLDHIITYIEITRAKLHALTLETHTIQEWLTTLAYYLKIINKPEHVKRLTSITFNHLFELLSELELTLHLESASLIILHPEEESPHDNPYDILGLPYDAPEEDIKKTYDEKMSVSSPDQLKTDLEEAGISPIKIEQRVRQLQAHQATLTDAYDRLKDPHLRSEIDRYRLHHREQQAALKTANITTTERLFDKLNTLIQQGIVSELEEFLRRYAPTEATLRQNIIEAEKSRFAEQRAVANLPITPSQIGGYAPFGGYNAFQQPFYPNNAYYPPFGNGSSFAPAQQQFGPASSTPQPGTEKTGTGGGGGSGGKSSPKDTKKEQEKKTEKSDNQTKKADGKKAEDSKKKVNQLETIKKGFTKLLDALKQPLTKLKEFLQADEQEDVRTQLKELMSSGGTKTITHTTFGKIHGMLKTYLSADIVQKFADIRKFITTHVSTNKRAIDACRPIWQAHRKAHKEVYTQLLPILCAQIATAMQKSADIVQESPWNSVMEICGHLMQLEELFKKPTPEKAGEQAKGEKAKKEKPGKPASSSSKPSGKKESGKPPTGEKEKTQVRPNTVLIQALNTIGKLEKAYEEAHSNFTDVSIAEEGKTLLTQMNELLQDKNLTELALQQFIIATWAPFMKKSGINEIINLKTNLKKLRAKANDQQKAQIDEQFTPIKDRAKKDYKTIVALEQAVRKLTNKLKTFRQPTVEIGAS